MLQSIINFIKNLLGIKPKNNNHTKQKQKITDGKIYQPRKLLTQTEIKFKNAIQASINENYILYPQINLASIIERKDTHKYQNELYRNIDFCIFDKFYNPVLLIEINDNTHNEKSRKARDYKVQDICASAGLPLVKFWTNYGVNFEYIKKKISEYIYI